MNDDESLLEPGERGEEVGDDGLADRFRSLEGREPVTLVRAMRGQGPPGAAWLAYAKQLMTAGRIDGALRELVILRVAWRCGSSYVWGGHALIAGDEGLRFPPERASAWRSEECLAVAVADQLLERGELDAVTRDEAFRHWSDEEVLELVMLIGQYHFLSLAARALGFVPEPGCRPLPPAWPGPDPVAGAPAR